MNINKIKKMICLAETKFLSLYDAEYENKKGKRKHWIIASRKNNEVLKSCYFDYKPDYTDAVVVAALHEASGSLVVIRQFRVPLNDYVYELPAGLIDSGEDIKYALNRELQEETGLKVTWVNEKLSSQKTYLSSGMTDESAAFIYCRCEGTITKDYLEEDEDIEAFLVSQEEAEVLVDSGAKMDIKAFIILNSFAKLGKDLFA